MNVCNCQSSVTRPTRQIMATTNAEPMEVGSEKVKISIVPATDSETDDEATPLIHSQKHLLLPSSSSSSSDDEKDNLNLSRRFAERMNTLKQLKTFKKAEQLIKDKFYPIVCIKRNLFTDKTTQTQHQAVHIESDEFLLAVPGQQKNGILKDVFGITENGAKTESDFAKVSENDVATFPSLYFKITDVQQSSFGSFPVLEFCVKSKK